MDRRRFLAEQLRRAALAGSLSWVVPFGPGLRALPAQPRARFEDPERFELMHALRDGRAVPPAEPSDTCEVVIVGGGLAGLVAAHRLAARAPVVVEKEPQAGGNSRSGEIAGCRYALGAFLSQGPIPPFSDYLRDSGAPFIALRGRDHALHDGGRTVRDPFGAGLDRLPWPAAERAALRAALDRLAPLGDPVAGLTFPLENGSDAHRAWDRRSEWAQYEQERLPARVRSLFDALLSARVGDSGEHLSAWYGSYLLANVLRPSFTMRGGHGAYAEVLARALAERPGALRTGFSVLRVEPHGADEVRVIGIDGHGRVASVAACCAVLAAPKHVAKHLVPGLAARRAAALAAYHYNAYLVAQVSLARPSGLPFETVVPAATLARFVVAPDALPGNARSDGGGVLTVYAPFPRRQGRRALLAAEAEALAGQLARELAPLLAGAAIEEIVLQRWGHPMLTARPGAAAAFAAAREPEGRIVFAHSDNLGITGLYSAVWAGMSAEADAESILS